MAWRGFGFVHRSRTLFCRAVPNPNITIRNFCISVRRVVGGAGGARQAAGEHLHAAFPTALHRPPPTSQQPLRNSQPKTHPTGTVKLKEQLADADAEAARAARVKARGFGLRVPAAPGVSSRVSPPTLQTLHDPILLSPWVCFRGGGLSRFSPAPHLSHCWKKSSRTSGSGRSSI
jgi:hypothetical protein